MARHKHKTAADRPRFTAEQQQYIDDFLESRLARQKVKLLQWHDAEMEAQRIEATMPESAQPQSADVEKLTHENHHLRKQQAMMSAAQQAADFIDLKEVCMLSERSVEWDDEVNDWRGVVRPSKERIERLPLTLYFCRLATVKPWLLKV